MYLGVDVGGTKTLLALFDDRGNIQMEKKFPTPQNYSVFLDNIKTELSSIDISQIQSVCLGLPSSLIDRKSGTSKKFVHLGWHNVNVKEDLARLFTCPIFFENDAKLAGYYEAIMLNQKYSRVLYLTISTGIGYAIIENENINTNVGDAGGSDIYIEQNGKMVNWEHIASGKAILEHYGKLAAQIDDVTTWKKICHNIALGLIELIAILDPDAIIIGGGVGEHFHKFSSYLNEELRQYELPSSKIPPILKAKNAEKAVIYGCYYYCKRNNHG